MERQKVSYALVYLFVLVVLAFGRFVCTGRSADSQPGQTQAVQHRKTLAYQLPERRFVYIAYRVTATNQRASLTPPTSMQSPCGGQCCFLNTGLLDCPFRTHSTLVLFMHVEDPSADSNLLRHSNASSSGVQLIVLRWSERVIPVSPHGPRTTYVRACVLRKLPCCSEHSAAGMSEIWMTSMSGTGERGSWNWGTWLYSDVTSVPACGAHASSKPARGLP